MSEKNTSYYLQDIIPIHSIGDGFVVSKDGAITVGFKLSMPEIDNLSGGDILSSSNELGMNLNGMLQDAIKELDYGYIFHQQDIFYYNDAQIPNSNGFLAKSVKSMYNEYRFLTAQTYIFITSTTNDFKKADYTDRAINQFTDNIQRFRVKLSALNPQRMTSDDWVDYLTHFFTCSFTPQKYAPVLDISFKDQMIGDYNITGYHVTGDKSIRELTAAMVNPNRSNSHTKRYNSRIAPICWDIPCYKVVNNIIVREKQERLILDCADFDAKMGLVSFGLANNASEAARDYKEILQQNGNNGILHSFNVFFMYRPEEKTKVEEKIEESFERIKLRPSKLTHINLEHLFMSSIGGCCSRLEFPLYLHPSLIEEAVCFSNLENSYRQASKGVVLADMRGNPCIVDLFSEPHKKGIINNWNWIAIGPSGTGKSVTMNKIISSLLLDEYFFFIIDNGNSYQNLCNMLGSEGRYIKLDATGSQLSFNPFLIPLINPATDTEHYLDAEIEIIRDTIFLAWDTDNMLGFKKDPNRSTYLSQLLMRFYEYRYSQMLDHVDFTMFYNFTTSEYNAGRINTKFFDYDSFSLVMQKFTHGQPFGFLFNGTVNYLDYQSLRMMVVELGELTERKELYKIVLGMTMILANRIIECLKTAHKQFILDEAWALVSEDYFGDFLKYQYKTIRKKGGGLCVIVQEVNDLTQSPHFAAITNNSDTLALLSHESKEAQIHENKNILSFTDDDASLALSIRKQDHAIFIRQGGKSKIYKVQLSPEELIMFSTTNKDRITFAQYLSQCSNNISLAIQRYCSEQNN